MIRNLVEAVSTNRLELPAGYQYSDPEAISYFELVELDEAANGPYDSPLDRADWHCPDYMGTRVDVGVRSNEGQLVGMGRLLLHDYSGGRVDIVRINGDLSHLMVHPDHRFRNIGTTILLERLRIADELGASKLCIDGLSDTNTISSKYSELGFIKKAGGQLKRSESLASQ